MEREVEGKFHFLDVGIKRTSDDILRRHKHLKSAWIRVYLNYNSFCPIGYNNWIVWTVSDCARKTCSKENLKEKLTFITTRLRENAYPAKFIEKYAKTNGRIK